MAVKCEACPLRGKELFHELSPDDVVKTQDFKSGELAVDPGTQILMEGSNSPQLYTTLHGMGLRYKILPDGRRQVINVVFPGDFIGLQAGVMQEMSHSVVATTHMRLCVFDRSRFYEFFKANPSRAFDITWLAATQEHFLSEVLASVGQRDALNSMAWAILRIYLRGKATSLARDGSMPLPYRQQDLADALGLSLVHTNKTLATLRKRQLVTWTNGTLHIHDEPGLAKLAQIEDLEPIRRPLL